MTTHGRPSFAPLFLEPFDLPNPEVRDVARGKAGVYVLRQRGIVRYVGSSVPEEKGGAREPLRLWKTVLRHFQRCKGAAPGRYGFGDDNFCTHDRNEWEIAIFDTHASDARKIEQDLIEHYKPTDQPKHTSDKRKARKPKNAGGRRKRNPWRKPIISAGDRVRFQGHTGEALEHAEKKHRTIRVHFPGWKRERKVAISELERCPHCGATDINGQCGGDGEGICDARAADDDAARKKNPPKRPKKGRARKGSARMANPYDNAEDRRTAYHFLKLATGGHLESMRDACKDEDKNGNFDDATADELADILGMWARDALAKDD